MLIGVLVGVLCPVLDISFKSAAGNWERGTAVLIGSGNVVFEENI